MSFIIRFNGRFDLFDAYKAKRADHVGLASGWSGGGKRWKQVWEGFDPDCVAVAVGNMTERRGGQDEYGDGRTHDDVNLEFRCGCDRHLVGVSLFLVFCAGFSPRCVDEQIV